MWGKGRQFRARCFAHISSLPHGTQVKNGTKGGPPFGVTSVPTSPHEHERAEQKGGPPFVPTSRTRCKGAVLLGVFDLFGSGPPFGVTQKEGLLLGKRWASFWGDSNGEPPCRVTSSCDTLPKHARNASIYLPALTRSFLYRLQSPPLPHPPPPPPPLSSPGGDPSSAPAPLLPPFSFVDSSRFRPMALRERR